MLEEIPEGPFGRGHLACGSDLLARQVPHNAQGEMDPTHPIGLCLTISRTSRLHSLNTQGAAWWWRRKVHPCPSQGDLSCRPPNRGGQPCSLSSGGCKGISHSPLAPGCSSLRAKPNPFLCAIFSYPDPQMSDLENLVSICRGGCGEGLCAQPKASWISAGMCSHPQLSLSFFFRIYTGKSKKAEKGKKPGRRKQVLTDCWVPAEAVEVGMGMGGEPGGEKLLIHRFVFKQLRENELITGSQKP